LPIPVTARSKALVCGRSPFKTEGSNSSGGMEVCLLWVVCIVRQRSLWRTGQSSRGVLPTVVPRCVRSRNLMNDEVLAHDGGCHAKNKQNSLYNLIYILNKFSSIE